ncbi:MAG: phospho-sugar mutase [Microbacteriaceae bacterium]
MNTIEAARAWLDQDPDATTHAELTSLISAAENGNADALAGLDDRFGSRLEFGTAGLRGELGAGSNRMNRVLVSQAAAGFAAYLLERGVADQNTARTNAKSQKSPSIVIGYDGRINSEVFARDTAELMAGAGVRAILLPRLLPTPVLAFAVRFFGVSAGVMVTASHNPARDNGYKVYLGDEDGGSQIVSPADSEIAEHISRISRDHSVLDLPRSNDYEVAGEDVVDEYVRQTVALAPANPRPLTMVYTAMHGVGWEVAERVFRDAGFATPVVVAEQIAPDATFPTVAFPNPEEPGAMDLAIAKAVEVGADVVIANDPDADRLAIAIPNDKGQWRRLSGNEVGAMLGWRAAERVTSSTTEADFSRRTLAASIVSSPALGHIARSYNLPFADTLTGFKWVSRVPELAYGYEEALGYLVDPAKVRDKDGISAAVEFLSLLSDIAEEGVSYAEHEAAFADKFGAFASSQISVRVASVSEIGRMMNQLRANRPATIGSLAVERTDDFIDGFENFPPGDILRFWLAEGARVIVRPSGTEPKLKVYIDASSTQGNAHERSSHALAIVGELDAAMRKLLES